MTISWNYRPDTCFSDLSSLDHEHTQDLIRRCREQLGAETKQLRRTLTESSNELKRTITNDGQETRDIIVQSLENISAKIDALHVPTENDKSLQSNRDVYFFGERQDMIMAYLLLAKAQLEAILDRLISADEASSLRQVAWLQSEFDHLVASAAQEEAARHPSSTALPIDRWHYFDHEYGAEPPSYEHAMNDSSVLDASDKTRAISRLDSPRLHQSQLQHISHKTPFGSMMVTVPKATQIRAVKSSREREAQEASLIFSCGIGSDLKIIQSYFRREASGPRICAQLNVFTLVPSEEPYDLLFAHASIPEVDQALRNGTISPYHINREGRNMCLYVSLPYHTASLVLI